MKCVRCDRPIGQAAVMVGAYAYGPKCARKAGLIVTAPVAAIKQPALDERQMPLGLTAPATAKQGRAYFHDGRKCIALEAWLVRKMDELDALAVTIERLQR